jgi:hypothetical protein
LFVGDDVPPVKKEAKLLGDIERWFKDKVVFEWDMTLGLLPVFGFSKSMSLVLTRTL